MVVGLDIRGLGRLGWTLGGLRSVVVVWPADNFMISLCVASIPFLLALFFP